MLSFDTVPTRVWLLRLGCRLCLVCWRDCSTRLSRVGWALSLHVAASQRTESMSMLNTDGLGQIGGFAVGRSVVGCLHNGADEVMYAYLGC